MAGSPNGESLTARIEGLLSFIPPTEFIHTWSRQHWHPMRTWDTKYLGIFPDTNFVHINSTVNKAFSVPNLARDRAWNQGVRFMYAALASRHANANKHNKLQVAQNKLLRMMAITSWYAQCGEYLYLVFALSHKYFRAAQLYKNPTIVEYLQYKPYKRFAYRQVNP